MKAIKQRTIMKTVLIIFAILLFLMLAVYINHKIHLMKESGLLLPIGQIVEVDGHNMSVYTEGDGAATLVFMSGSGTCSPILDFKSLYSLLSDKYRIAVVEKFGYGFSDVVDKSRDIDSVLENTRAALNAAGLYAPYVLCPHSMSGLEALYWTQKYPEEVKAIIGLDMAVPQYYDNTKINIPLMKITSFAASIGIPRLIPGIAESEAIRHGTLSDREKEIYKAVFYSRTATKTMINEAESAKENAETVDGMGVPPLPMLLFVSNASGGTGFDEKTWRKIALDYISRVDGGKYIELDCPHYVHDYEYEKISEETVKFLTDIK